MIPFSLKFNQELSQFLYDMKITIAVSTYQAGKVVLISAKTPDRLIQLPRSFDTPMGMALEKNHLAISTIDEVIKFTNEPKAAAGYHKENTYDALFVPTATYYTGKVHMHDIAFGKQGLYAINTNFSMLGIVNGAYNFIPIWKPSFIKEMTSLDQCHLNGMAMHNGEPRFVTALAPTNEPQGWRPHKLTSGVLIDIKTNKTIMQNLKMPHSPRIYKDKLYLLQSATGELLEIDLANQKMQVIKNLKGFVRGMEIYNDYAFIGLSKIRETSHDFGDMPIVQDKEYINRAGVVVVHIPTKAIIGEIIYENSVDEIYDIKILPDIKRPNILNTIDDEYKNLIIYPDIAFWATKKDDNSQHPLQIRKYFDTITYNNIILYDIYQTRDYDQYIIKYWLDNDIYPQNEAFKQVEEVAVIMLDSTQTIIGVITMYKDIYENQSYYFGRISIQYQLSFRDLWKKAISFTRENFAKREIITPETEGIIIEIENNKLEKEDPKSYFKSENWIEKSNNDKNQPVWQYRFNQGATNANL